MNSIRFWIIQEWWLLQALSHHCSHLAVYQSKPEKTFLLQHQILFLKMTYLCCCDSWQIHTSSLDVGSQYGLLSSVCCVTWKLFYKKWKWDTFIFSNSLFANSIFHDSSLFCSGLGLSFWTVHLLVFLQFSLYLSFLESKWTLNLFDLFTFSSLSLRTSSHSASTFSLCLLCTCVSSPCWTCMLHTEKMPV